MITNQDVALWSIDHPWQSADRAEQDLLLSQAIFRLLESSNDCEVVFLDGIIGGNYPVKELVHG